MEEGGREVATLSAVDGAIGDAVFTLRVCNSYGSRDLPLDEKIYHAPGLYEQNCSPRDYVKSGPFQDGTKIWWLSEVESLVLDSEPLSNIFAPHGESANPP